MDKSIVLNKGKHIHYFKQPESRDPTVLVVVKRKKAGLDIVKCHELGRISERLYTLDKLEFIPKENKNIMENINDYNTAPEEDIVTNETFEFKIESSKFQYFKVQASFKQSKEDGKLQLHEGSVQITNVIIGTDLMLGLFEYDFTNIIFKIFNHDMLLEAFEEEIDERFSAHDVI